METILEQPGYSLDDLLWEHCEYSKRLIKLFEKYQRQVEKENRDKYDRGTQRIIFNTICKIEKNTGINNFKVFVEDFNKSLKMVLVFTEKDFHAKVKELYEVIPQIQDLSIKHEGRDFRWNIMSDKYLDKEVIESEFVYFIQVENK